MLNILLNIFLFNLRLLFCMFIINVLFLINIYEKIKDGHYDPSREGNGVKLGVMASAPKSVKKSGGCC